MHLEGRNIYVEDTTGSTKNRTLNQPIYSGSRMKIGLEIQRFLTILPSKWKRKCKNEHLVEQGKAALCKRTSQVKMGKLK